MQFHTCCKQEKELHITHTQVNTFFCGLQNELGSLTRANTETILSLVYDSCIFCESLTWLRTSMVGAVMTLQTLLWWEKRKKEE